MITVHMHSPVQSSSPIFEEELTRVLIEDSLKFSTVDPGGFETMEFTLKGGFVDHFRWLRERYFYQIKAYDHLHQTVFDGRITNAVMDEIGLHLTVKGYWDATLEDSYYEVHTAEEYSAEMIQDPGFEDLNAIGAELLSNEGFETWGTNPHTDPFTVWVESYGDGDINKVDTGELTGDWCAEVIAGPNRNTYMYQTYAATAGHQHVVSIFTKGDGDYSGRYRIRDETQAADIQALVTLDRTSQSYGEVVIWYIVPSGCASVGLYLYCADNDTSICYYDDISVRTFNDVWPYWEENRGDGMLNDEISVTHEGEHAAKVVAGSSADTYLKMQFSASAGTVYRVAFWTRGDGENGGRYKIYNDTAGTDIIELEETKIRKAIYKEKSMRIVGPAGIAIMSIYLYCSTVDGTVVYYDDLSVTQITEQATDPISTMIGYALDQCPAISSDRTNIDTNSTPIRREFDSERPGILITRWLESGDESGNRWKFGVWEDRIPYYEQVSFTEGKWKIHLDDLDRPRLDGSSKELYSHVAVRYWDRDLGESVVTAYATTGASIDAVKRKIIYMGEGTTREAEAQRATQAARSGDPKLTIQIPVGFFIHDIYGNRWPSWSVRAGDVVDIDELIADPDLLSSTEKIGRCFIVKTEWQNGHLTLVPEVSAKLVKAFG